MGYKILGKANEVKDQAEATVSNAVDETSSVVSEVVETPFRTVLQTTK